MVNCEATVKVLQVLHRGKTSRYRARLDLPHSLPAYMHEDHAENECQTGDTLKRLMIKVDTEVAKDRRDHGIAQNYPCVWSSWTGLEATSTMSSSSASTMLKESWPTYTLLWRVHTCMFSLAALGAAMSAMLAIRSLIHASEHGCATD